MREFLKTNCSFSKKEVEEKVESIISVDEKELEENGVPIECNGGVLMIWMKNGVLRLTFICNLYSGRARKNAASKI